MASRLIGRADAIPRTSRPCALSVLATEAARMESLLRSLPVEQWALPTASAGWTVHDVAAHVVGQFEGLARPWVTWRRIRRARRDHPELGILDGHNRCQVEDRRELPPESMIDLLERFAAGSLRMLGLAPGPVRRLPLSLLFPEARELPEDRVDYLLRVLAARDVWMHRLETADAVGRRVVSDRHDRYIVEQVIADLGAAWTGPAVQLTLTGRAGGAWLIGSDRPRTALTADAIGLMRHLSGRRARSLDLQVVGDQAARTGMLSATVPF
jgi:uncharacterized protein (TIGR03083 family)